MTSVVYYPAFEDADLLQQQIARACWYLSPINPAQVRMQSPLQLERYVPEGYTPEVDQHASELPSWLRLSNEQITKADLAKADIVLLWRGLDTLNDFGDKTFAELRSQGVTIYNVDYKDRMEGSRYIDVSHRFPANDAAVTKQSRARFTALQEDMKEQNRAYLFCSGPEVARYTEHTFEDGISIICNSVINDADLLAAAPPHVQIFGDPIFHFGCSQYAHEFRSKLTETQAQYGYRCIVPMKYFNLFTYWQPHLADVTMAVPFDVNLDINLNLADNYTLHTTDNILTFLMLPVASTLAQDIYLLGCDGRPLNQNDYFWKHNEKTQFVGQMSNIQDVHPSFFKVDYDEYYLRHCANTEAYFAKGEQTGHRYFALTPSHIPALKERQTEKILTELPAQVAQTVEQTPAEPVAVAVKPHTGAKALERVAEDVASLLARPSSSSASSGDLAQRFQMADFAYELGKQKLGGQQTHQSVQVLQNKVDALRTENTALKEHQQALKDQLSTMSDQLKTMQELIEHMREDQKQTAQVASRIAAQNNEFIAKTEAVNKRVTELNTKVNTGQQNLQTANSLTLERTKTLKLELQLEQKRLADQIKSVGERERNLAERHKALETRQRESTAQTNYLSRTERFRSNEPDFQVFSRHLTKEEIEQFTNEAHDVFGLDLQPRSIAYMAHRIRQLESNSIGRLATSIHAALTRAIALLSLPQDKLNYAEIGVLFGINTAIAWDLLRYKFKSTKLTCIDPLEGYYDADALDTLTGVPINETVLKQNLKRAFCDMRHVTILKGLSEDPKIIEQAAKSDYNFLLIDGDHSYDGVRRDFENYAPMVISGGIVAVDDYGAPEWPEVTAYCDRFLMDHPDYEMLSKSHRTLILRKH